MHSYLGGEPLSKILGVTGMIKVSVSQKYQFELPRFASRTLDLT